VLAACILGSSMSFVDGSVVNLALPTLQRSLGATVTDVQWVVESYELFLASLLLIGGALAFFSHYLAPTVLRIPLRRKTHDVLFGIGLAMVAYGIVLTVLPAVWTPFAAKFMLPKTGWQGVFAVAIVFDLTAAVIAFFVLRKMKVPVQREVTSEDVAPPALAAARQR